MLSGWARVNIIEMANHNFANSTRLSLDPGAPGLSLADGSPSPREGSGEPTGLAPSRHCVTDTGLRMSAPSTAVEETRLGTPSTAATAAKRSREADTEHVFKTPRTALAGSSGSSAAAIEETPDTAVAGSSASGSPAAAIDGLLAQLILALKANNPSHIDGSQLESAQAAHCLLGSLIAASGSSAAALSGLLAQIRPIIRAFKATDPSHIDEGQLASAKEAKYLLGSIESFIDGVEAQQEAIRNPPPVETPLNFDDMVHTLSFLDCKSLAAAAVVSRHWCRAAPEAVTFRLNHLSGTYSSFTFFARRPAPTAQLLAQVEREFKRIPPLIQQINLSQSESEFEQTRDELEVVERHVLRLHSNLLWGKVREAGRDASENTHAFELRERLFQLLMYAYVPADELAPHASCVVDVLPSCPPEGLRYVSTALQMMSRMPATVIEKHIDSVMFWVIAEPQEYGDFFIQSTALQVIANLAPKTLASLNLKAQIAAAPLAKSKLRSEREQVAELLKKIPD